MGARAALSRSSSRLLEFLRTEEASAALLLAAALLALVWANSAMRDSYAALWSSVAGIRIGDFGLVMDLRHWVNEGLMTFFFLVVGLEIKREIVSGELRDSKKLRLPAIAALGGMVVPAGIYLLFNAGRSTAAGWGVPVATDIAFALGVLTLAASKAPLSLRSFLLTLAIVDDIGAIVLIALFYSSALSLGWLVSAVAIILVIVIAKRLRVASLIPYIFLGIGLWLSLYHSGIHPTLAGVVLGLMAPAAPLRRSPDAATEARHYVDEAASGPQGDVESNWVAIGDIANGAVAPLDTVETRLHPWTTRLVVPAFALANAGVEFDMPVLTEAVTGPVGVGVVLGLVVGKPVGIFAAIWIATSLGIGRMSNDVTPRMALGVSALAGVGFTVALFITELAFESPRDIEASKLAVLLASLIASLLGAFILRSANSAKRSRSPSTPDAPAPQARRTRADRRVG